MTREVPCPYCGKVNRCAAERLRAKPRCGHCREPLFTGRPLQLGEETFSLHAERGDIPVVVDFWAPWCGPCLKMERDFERAASVLEPEARLAKVNTDDHQRLAGRHAIRGIPTVIVFKGGRELARRSGAVDQAQLVAWVRSLLA